MSKVKIVLDRRCYDGSWQIVFSDLWKKEISLNSWTYKRADWEPMFHWWCLVIKYLVILSKFELVKNFEINWKFNNKRCINDLANKPWLNEHAYYYIVGHKQWWFSFIGGNVHFTWRKKDGTNMLIMSSKATRPKSCHENQQFSYIRDQNYVDIELFSNVH